MTFEDYFLFLENYWSMFKYPEQPKSVKKYTNILI